MLHCTIPIHAVAAPLALHVVEPAISGEPEGLLGMLDRAVGAELGTSVPRGAWMRAFHVDSSEATLSLAPELKRCLPAITQATFDVLRRALRNTDIYVRTAAH